MLFLGIENFVECIFFLSKRQPASFAWQRKQGQEEAEENWYLQQHKGVRSFDHIRVGSWFMWHSVHAANVIHAPFSVVVCLSRNRMCTTGSRDKKNTYVYRLSCKHTRCMPRCKQQQFERSCGLQSVVNGLRGGGGVVGGWRPRRWESCTLSGFKATKSNCIIQHWSTVLRPVNYA